MTHSSSRALQNAPDGTENACRDMRFQRNPVTGNTAHLQGMCLVAGPTGKAGFPALLPRQSVLQPDIRVHNSRHFNIPHHSVRRTHHFRRTDQRSPAPVVPLDGGVEAEDRRAERGGDMNSRRIRRYQQIRLHDERSEVMEVASPGKIRLE